MNSCIRKYLVECIRLKEKYQSHLSKVHFSMKRLITEHKIWSCATLTGAESKKSTVEKTDLFTDLQSKSVQF